MYSDAIFRHANPFAAIEHARDWDFTTSFERFDTMLDHGEDSEAAGDARRALNEPTRKALLEAHRLLFNGREGSGTLRQSAVVGPYPGQDCPDPEYIAQSLENFEAWLRADSFGEMHAIEQAALALTRLVDIWPFAFGNRTTAVLFANYFLARRGYPPFFILSDQRGEFEQILAMAIRMQTEPLVRAIYKCLEREIELVRD